MHKLRWTAFGLRLLGIALLLLALRDVAYWLNAVLRALFGVPGVSAVGFIEGTLRAWSLWWLFLVAAGFVLTLRPAAVSRLLWTGLDKGGCPKCGYDRRGLATDAPCPECGSKP